MATETRVLRPFPTPSALEDFFKSTVLEVGDFMLAPSGRATLDHDSYLHSTVRLHLGGRTGMSGDNLEDICAGLEEIGVNPDHAEFAVNLYSGFLKISEYVLRHPVSRLLDVGNVVDIAVPGSRPHALRTPYSGCRVEASVLLGVTGERRPGRPWRKGTWLARSRYFVSCDLEFAGFTPRPMDAAQKEALGLPSNATRYVTLPAGLDPVREDASPDVLEMWVDSDLLAAISAQPKSGISMALQRQLFVDAFAAITHVARSDSGLQDVQWAEIEGTLLGRLIRGLAGRDKRGSEGNEALRSQHLLNVLRVDHAKFMATVEDHAGVTNSLIKALQD